TPRSIHRRDGPPPAEPARAVGAARRVAGSCRGSDHGRAHRAPRRGAAPRWLPPGGAALDWLPAEGPRGPALPAQLARPGARRFARGAGDAERARADGAPDAPGWGVDPRGLGDPHPDRPAPVRRARHPGVAAPSRARPDDRQSAGRSFTVAHWEHYLARL